MTEQRAQWKSKMGFILAASGSAIGLGNIVVFSGNAYKFGGGAFYLPYFVALFLIGIPVMIMEFGLGGMTRKSFPIAMRQAGGRAGEWVGWFAILNAGIISIWYVTLLAWVVGMGLGAMTNKVFVDTVTVDWVGGTGAPMQGPQGYFFQMIAGWLPVVCVIVVWALNVIITWRGTQTIEKAVKVFVPLMWVAMILLVVQGLFFLDGGFDGVKVLFTPHKEALGQLSVWQGSVSQILFTLSLGFGVMTAYASYLPKKSDMTHNAVTTSLLNCGFEWIAGAAIFSILFVYAIEPKASTLAMMYFTVPWGIKALPVNHQVFGTAFFLLLLVAGLTSSISLVEAVVAAARDKFRASRMKVLAIVFVIGVVGSVLCSLPTIVDQDLKETGTLGLLLVDLFGHWSFDTGLIIVAILECIVIGWVMGVDKIRAYVNDNSRFNLGLWFNALIKWVIPGSLSYILIYNFVEYDAKKGALYGSTYAAKFGLPEGPLASIVAALPIIALVVWVVGTAGVALWLTRSKGAEEETA
jgi:NSS family neurotransmitter:Na+ symporter